MAAIKIGDILKSRGLANDKQINIAIVQQRLTGELLGDVIVKLGFVSAKELSQALAEQGGMEFIDLSDYPISEDALKLIPRELAENAAFIPFDIINEQLCIGVTNPSNILAIDKVTALTKRHPKVYMVDADSLRASLEKAYFFMANPIEARKQNILNDIMASDAAITAAIPTLTELIIMDGIRRRTTDIHINPGADIIHIFYRIDGVLQYGHGLPNSVKSGIVSRIKVLSSLDISESRLPQDGSFTFEIFHKKYEIRVSTVPNIYGENVVLRVLAGTGSLPRAERLGFSEDNIRTIRDLFQKPYGIILVAGPTGSGKTTTLYAALREINFLERNILTIEDPVEYKLSLVKQSQVNEKAGYDFAHAARNFMRQDPDVILLGEIRDEETAQIAIRAAITGHLVLSTIHASDSMSCIPRLVDMKVDKFLMSSSLLAIIAQRLARRICPFCKMEYELKKGDREIFEEFGINFDKLYTGAGCKKCEGTGYTGRLVIGEIMLIDNEMKELIFNNFPITKLQEAAIHKGMMPFKGDGLRKAALGLTSLEEILRVTG